MKKFASMMMAAVMIFALAVPAFAGTTAASVKATMQSPKVALTAGKVAVIANPYRIKVTLGNSQVQDQIVNAPVAFINKSDTGLSMKLVVTPTTNNNIKFLPALDLTDDTKTVKDGKQVPCANVIVAAKFDEGDYSSTAGAAFTEDNWAAGDDCLVATLDGTMTVMGTTGKVPASGETADAYTNPTSGTDANAKAITLAVPENSGGNAVWVRVSGTMSTNVDYTSWKDGDGTTAKAATLEFSVAFITEPVANEVE